MQTHRPIRRDIKSLPHTGAEQQIQSGFDPQRLFYRSFQ